MSLMNNNPHFRLNLSEEDSRLLLSIIPIAALESTHDERRIVRDVLKFSSDADYLIVIQKDGDLLQLGLLLLYLVLLSRKSNHHLEHIMNHIVFYDKGLESRIYDAVRQKVDCPISVEELEGIWNMSSIK